MDTAKSLGKYQIIEEMGRGGFATVYRARDPDLDREVALKVLDPLLTRDPVWVARFRREARAVARLDHSHVVTIYEVGQAEGMLFIATRLVEGGTLAERIRQRGTVGWDEVVRLVGEIAEALDYAHEQGVIHRDLKAANVLLDRERGAQLTDFGFASIVSESSYSVSISGGVVGTPQYIAPEVWEGQAATAQTDVYALGCILYEMVVGKHLFQGDTTPSVMRAHFQPIELPEAWPEGVPPGLDEILRVALAKDVEARYARAGELTEAMAGLRADRLAESYAALEATVATEAWEQALRLAQEIQAEDPDYGSVVALEEFALEGLERAARTKEAATWQAEAERALAEGDLQGAELAARQWRNLMPDDPEVESFLTGLMEATDLSPAALLPGPPEPILETQMAQPALANPVRRVPPRVWILSGLVVLALAVGLGLTLSGGMKGSLAPVALLDVTPTATRPISTIAPSSRPADTHTPTSTITPSPSNTATPTLEPTASKTATPSATPTSTDTDTPTPTPKPTDTATPKPTPAGPPRITSKNAERVALLRTLNGHSDSVFGVDFSPDGEMVASGSVDKTVRLWKASDGTQVRVIQQPESVADVDFSPEGKTLATGHSGLPNRSVNLWQVSDGVLSRSLQGDDRLQWAVVFSPDGSIVASGSTGNALRLWRVSDGVLLHKLDHPDPVFGVGFSPDGTLIASGSLDGRTRVWRVSDGTLLQTWAGHSGLVYSILFSPDGKMLASSSVDRKVVLRRVSDGELLRTLNHASAVEDIAFSPDGKILASALYQPENSVQLWQVSDGSLLRTLKGHDALVSSVAFSPDGGMLASGSEDATVRLWGVPTD
jgi:WD40 repeat protein